MSFDRDISFRTQPGREVLWDPLRPARDVWRSLGMSGDASGSGGSSAHTFLYALGAVAAMVGVVNTINVVTILHENPAQGMAPVVGEGSSWVTILLFLWIPWLGWRIAPPFVRPRAKLLLHLPMLLAFALAHVGGFIVLRKLVYWLAGTHYSFGQFVPGFLYEIRKDALGYALFIAGFSLIEHLLRQRQPIEMPTKPATIDIRDGARLRRVHLDEVLAVTSAGNYVEFVLRDHRRLLMRAPLSSVEAALGERGFLRTHRSWLVNATHLTALRPEGSGDYTVELGAIEVPLSRRFPEALAKLRGGQDWRSP